MSVLVTGSDGFIGRHVVALLLEKGYTVLGLDNRSNHVPDATDIQHENYTFFWGCVTDEQLMNRLVSQCSHVIHLAAVASVPRSLRDPLLYMKHNVLGFNVVLEACRQSPVFQKLVYASSSSVLGTTGKGDVISPYAWSKKANEELAALYWDVYKVPSVGVRFFNVYGPGQRADSSYAAVIPKFRVSSEKRGVMHIFGDGHQTRSFTYVKDVAKAVVASMATKLCNQVLDIAHSDSRSVNQVAELFRRIYPDVKIQHMPPRKGDIQHSKPTDLNLTHELLQWRADICLEDGVMYYLDEAKILRNK